MSDEISGDAEPTDHGDESALPSGASTRDAPAWRFTGAPCNGAGHDQ